MHKLSYIRVWRNAPYCASTNTITETVNGDHVSYPDTSSNLHIVIGQVSRLAYLFFYFRENVWLLQCTCVNVTIVGCICVFMPTFSFYIPCRLPAWSLVVIDRPSSIKREGCLIIKRKANSCRNKKRVLLCSEGVRPCERSASLQTLLVAGTPAERRIK